MGHRTTTPFPKQPDLDTQFQTSIQQPILCIFLNELYKNVPQDLNYLIEGLNIQNYQSIFSVPSFCFLQRCYTPRHTLDTVFDIIPRHIIPCSWNMTSYKLQYLRFGCMSVIDRRTELYEFFFDFDPDVLNGVHIWGNRWLFYDIHSVFFQLFVCNTR